jgi:hypothetical protein
MNYPGLLAGIIPKSPLLRANGQFTNKNGLKQGSAHELPREKKS